MSRAATQSSNEPNPSGDDRAPSQRPADAPPLSLLAKEMFGHDFHGEVKAPAAPAPARKPPERVPPSDLEPATILEEGDEGDQGADEDVDAGDEGDEGAQDQGDETPAGDEGDEAPIKSMRELLDHLEADPEWFNGLNVDVRVDDQTSQVPLKDVIAAYQQNQAAEARFEQAKAARQAAQQEQAQRTAALETQFQTAAALVNKAEELLNADVAKIDWTALQEADPGQFAALRVQVQERQKIIDDTKQQLIGQYQASVHERQAQLTNQQSAILAEQAQLLMNEMPKVNADWKDPGKVDGAKAQLAGYLISQGFSKEDVMGASDHRLLLIAEKARLYDATKGKVQLNKKRILKVPKVLKPGASKEPSAINLEAVQNARSKLKATGSMDDALTVLRAKRTKRR